MLKYTLAFCFSISITIISGCGGDSSLPSVSASGPTIIKKSFLKQVGPIADTTMLTPVTDGDFRVSAYVSCPIQQQPPDGTFGIHFDWVDENGEPTSVFDPGFSIQFGTSNVIRIAGQSVAVIHAKGGTAIKISQNNSGDHVSSCDIFAAVEPLQ